MTEKDTKVVSALETEIQKIINKENRVYFYVYDTKGSPSESLYYIYDLALNVQNAGYDVKMLYSDKEFVGVGKWMGEEYAKIPHLNIEKDNVALSVSDFLFIPEINANVMAALKNKKEVLCKKVAILTNLHYLSDIMRPIGTTWANLGISECIAMTKELADGLHEIFPTIKTHVIPPRIHQDFNIENTEPKPLVVNIISKTNEHANSIVNNLHWKYRQYGFLAIRELKGLSIEEKAKALKGSFLTIWLDTDTEFGLEALEAMACGSIVAGKVPEDVPSWMIDANGEVRNNGIWFTKNSEIQDAITSAVQTYLYDELPEILYSEMADTVKMYDTEHLSESLQKVMFDGLFGDRIKEFRLLIDGIENNTKGENEEK